VGRDLDGTLSLRAKSMGPCNGGKGLRGALDDDCCLEGESLTGQAVRCGWRPWWPSKAERGTEGPTGGT
jgi:hypothetical protein